jgi:hypothetical protein
MTVFTLQGMAAHLLTMTADIEHAKHATVERACQLVEKEAKSAMGNYRFGWTPLKPATIERKLIYGRRPTSPSAASPSRTGGHQGLSGA